MNGDGKDIQIWANTINWKGVIEEVINCTIVLFSRLNFLVVAFLLNAIT